ncbi:LacI family DNA-binding transcriptional regulator [Sphingopyxis alaskensis]|jgi:LacI family transcriptional regulator|uniref:Transcriptional regulator, LacI family n=1 Tax=Sphingopyxis alaskensis (strain DSM 13593 / LMG 18877 / RB2256) TaxID=317655 RepID=Q1GUN4_SPHAL|nr:LacI family DNA-binding transcriptional regulator [Sphingopyxis alaskensis]ABF52638.1 transcriptional regulator, LacI family [Sphingopyxis alaskensis RB2256]MCM3418171.1 LacI family DNA-binding transcriptional regulator [Sphingopyxis alaskensis]
MARRRQAVTIKHVAADAGVSLQTVSRVINDEPNVRSAMKARVQASIDKLGYVPSIAARRMSGSRSYLILAINDRDRTIADWTARQGTDWVDQMLLGGMLKCAEYGYRLIFELVDTHSDHVERELRATIAALQPDGVILTPPHSDNPLIVRLLERQRIPFARIGSRGGGAGIALVMDDESMARHATRHLIDLGHRRIAFIAGSSEYPLSQWRVDGWESEMRAAGLPTAGLVARGDFTYESGAAATRQLLGHPDRPSAIIASNDQMALAALEVARELGIEIPSQLSLVSFDNTPIVRFTQPTLTAVDQPVAETVSRAVEMIIKAQRGEKLPPQPVIVAGGFVERESTSAPAHG